MSNGHSLGLSIGQLDGHNGHVQWTQWTSIVSIADFRFLSVMSILLNGHNAQLSKMGGQANLDKF